jgi:hypothetical protein
MADDPEKIAISCDLVVDYLNQQRKNSRPRKNVRLILNRDGSDFIFGVN